MDRRGTMGMRGPARGAHGRLRTLSRHLVAAPTASLSMEMLQSLESHPDWASKPFWMLHLIRLKAVGNAHQIYRTYFDAMTGPDGELTKAGGRPIFYAYAKTVIGLEPWDIVVIGEYPSPAAFTKLVFSPEYLKGPNQIRLQVVDDMAFIPMTAGWYRIQDPAPSPSRPLKRYTADNVWGEDNGLVGGAVAGARPGVTSSSEEQAKAFASDSRIGSASEVWHLNLLNFSDGTGAVYNKYAKAMGSKDGVLSQFGARSPLAARCFKGWTCFDRAIFAVYPSRDAYLSMGASPEYLKTAHFRHEGLQETYIISCVPEFIDKEAVAAGLR